jgi:hypothetical protein
MTDASRDDLLTREQIPTFLKEELGIPIKFATLNKLCIPSVGQGPPVEIFWSRRPLYRRSAVRDWALGRCRPSQPQTAPEAA